MKSVILAGLLLSGGAAMAQAPSDAPAPASDYPPCSRTVMDKCTETGMMGHKAMRHKMKAHHKAMAKKPMASGAATTPDAAAPAATTPNGQ